jgi:hypothetical protein
MAVNSIDFLCIPRRKTPHRKVKLEISDIKEYLLNTG